MILASLDGSPRFRIRKSNCFVFKFCACLLPMVSEILGRDDKSLRRVHGRESPTSRWSDDKLLARVPSPAPGFVEGRALSGRGVRRLRRSGAPLGVLDVDSSEGAVHVRRGLPYSGTFHGPACSGGARGPFSREFVTAHTPSPRLSRLFHTPPANLRGSPPPAREYSPVAGLLSR